ncbi:MAG: GNAT family N-acetyltransferase [Pontixanthobacter sp.]
MEYRYATIGEADRMAELHPELFAARPDLASPAFPENPIAGEADFPFIFYVSDGADIVGSRKAIPDTALIGGTRFDWSWCFDTYVSPNHHGKGIGKKLVAMQVEAFERLNIISGAAFSAPAMMHIYAKLGYRVLECAPRMTLVRDPKPFIAAKLPFEPVLSMASAAAALALKMEQRLRGSRKADREFRLTPIDREAFASRFQNAEFRSGINHWALSDAWPVARLHHNDELVLVEGEGSGDALALMVLRERAVDPTSNAAPRRLSIVYFVPLEAGAGVTDIIAAGVARLLSERKMDVVDLITSSPDLIESFRKRAFRARGEGMTFVYKIPSALDIPQFEDIADWHLTHFCSDGFLFE